ncbi:type II toxin-antitoxin system Phd/YefM family antitoxin [Pseudorhodoferax soli]|uniref:Antitoxin n=1 Tax=Pseudorhodoferax soli TaxID=545864 RepID=A0A368XWP8_9BURK|nr:type II toxin-antitoxin system prevent-host-death family antitoxin [Pseudorhodoferax soli]RCW70454.1 prevent-host-death family protein [Pseudorhodoferax soli]
MAAIGLFEAKTHLSEYVARAEAGEEVIITRHNKPVAKIVPLAAELPAAQEIAPFVQRTYSTGVPLVDLTRANQLAAELEDEELMAKMRRIEARHQDPHAPS